MADRSHHPDLRTLPSELKVHEPTRPPALSSDGPLVLRWLHHHLVAAARGRFGSETCFRWLRARRRHCLHRCFHGVPANPITVKRPPAIGKNHSLLDHPQARRALQDEQDRGPANAQAFFFLLRHLNLAKFTESGPASPTPSVPSFSHSSRLPKETSKRSGCRAYLGRRSVVAPASFPRSQALIAVRGPRLCNPKLSLYLQQPMSNSQTGWFQVGTGFNSCSIHQHLPACVAPCAQSLPNLPSHQQC